MNRARRPDDRAEEARVQPRGDRPIGTGSSVPQVAVGALVAVDVQFGADAAVLMTIDAARPEHLDAHAVTALFALGLQIGPQPRRRHSIKVGTLEVAGDVRFLVGHTSIGHSVGLRAVRAGIEHVLRHHTVDSQQRR